MDLIPEDIDLADLTRRLRDASGRVFVGAIVGRTAIRDEVASMLDCSLLEAEQLVDTMIGRGFLIKERPEDGPEQWVLADRQATP